MQYGFAPNHHACRGTNTSQQGVPRTLGCSCRCEDSDILEKLQIYICFPELSIHPESKSPLRRQGRQPCCSRVLTLPDTQALCPGTSTKFRVPRPATKPDRQKCVVRVPPRARLRVCLRARLRVLLRVRPSGPPSGAPTSCPARPREGQLGSQRCPAVPAVPARPTSCARGPERHFSTLRCPAGSRSTISAAPPQRVAWLLAATEEAPAEESVAHLSASRYELYGACHELCH